MMYKCLKITFIANLQKDFLQETIQKRARDLLVEGVAQVFQDGTVKIIVCGVIERVDKFMDHFYEDLGAFNHQELFVEPFLKDKDYRGVFRILE